MGRDVMDTRDLIFHWTGDPDRKPYIEVMVLDGKYHVTIKPALPADEAIRELKLAMLKQKQAARRLVAKGV